MTFNHSKYFLSEYALKNKTEIDLKILKKRLYKENTIAKLFFSNENQKKVQMQDKKFEKCHKRLLSIFQNTFAKLYLEKEH